MGPVYQIMESFVGVREKTCIIFVYGLLLMKQQNLQEARLDTYYISDKHGNSFVEIPFVFHDVAGRDSYITSII